MNKRERKQQTTNKKAKTTITGDVNGGEKTGSERETNTPPTKINAHTQKERKGGAKTFKKTHTNTIPTHEYEQHQQV